MFIDHKYIEYTDYKVRVHVQTAYASTILILCKLSLGHVTSSVFVMCLGMFAHNV